MEGGNQLVMDTFISNIGKYYGEGPAVKEILQGTYSPSPLASAVTQAFLQACKPQTLISRRTPSHQWFSSNRVSML